VYPQFHTVSFSLIAQKHIEYMRKLSRVNVYEMDELQIDSFMPVARYRAVIHPAIFIMHRIIQNKVKTAGASWEKSYMFWRRHYDQLIGIDVCDSDRMSEYAVSLVNMFDKVIVPSSFCVDVYKSSGVKIRIYRVPHGVDPYWYETPNTWESKPVSSINPMVLELFLYKVKHRVRYLLFWFWHSPDRKGVPELIEFYRKLKRERKDVVLILKTQIPNPAEFMAVADLGAINVYGWLDEANKMALYDLADITLMFSRGGGFELNALESLARGIPVVTSNWGSWTDYVPEFLRVKVGRRVQPLPNNVIHVGYGYTVDVDDVVNKVLDILDNYEEYRAKTEEWRMRVLANEYRWDLIASKLIDVVGE